MRSSLAFRLIASVGMASALCAQEAAKNVENESLGNHARQYLQARVFDLGLDASHDFAPRNVLQDDLGESHIRVDQFVQGVRVFGGEAIIHMRDGQVRDTTDALVRGLRLNPNPTLGTSEALAMAHEAVAPKGAYASDPTAELVFATIERSASTPRLRTATNDESGLVSPRAIGTRMALVYHVHTELENGAEETRHTDFLIDAHSGEILKSWDTLHTTAATGSGKSQYSGIVSISTNSTTSGFELRDNVRTMPFTTLNLNHATTGTGTIYTDADNTWGDSANYVEGSSTTAANGQTAGVDAHFGTMKTFDMYKNVLGRNGINGAGKATYNRVHYSNAYDNAFWSDTCFCMTYGDGTSFKTLTAIDVAGHEMTHGVTASTAKLNYSGESGGLNEAMSDIFGTMTEFYAKGGGTTTIPATGGNWTIGEQLATKPLRYMYKPSLDGASRDAWSSTLGSLDVHYSSGPMNRCFYFLSMGASATSSSTSYSSYLPAGMTGIGNTAATKIVYRALTVYMTSTTNYAAAKIACQKAATDLYGATSAQYAAVTNAFKAINR
jgi:Zn-dependent metalloprotease